MITGEPRWARIIEIHPYWCSPRYWRLNDQKIVKLDLHNEKVKAAYAAKKQEAEVS